MPFENSGKRARMRRRFPTVGYKLRRDLSARVPAKPNNRFDIQDIRSRDPRGQSVNPASSTQVAWAFAKRCSSHYHYSSQLHEL
jgi:hypothetical protein